MSYEKIPEIYNIICDNCGKKQSAQVRNDIPSHWAVITIKRYGSKDYKDIEKHYCPGCISCLTIIQ